MKREEIREQELEEVLLGADNNTVKYKLPEERKTEIECKRIELIEKEVFFLDSHLTLDHLPQKLGINRNDISETLSGSKYGSFYTLINHYRLEHAIEMFRENPKQKIEQVSKALASHQRAFSRRYLSEVKVFRQRSLSKVFSLRLNQNSILADCQRLSTLTFDYLSIAI